MRVVKERGVLLLTGTLLPFYWDVGISLYSPFIINQTVNNKIALHMRYENT